MISFIFWYLLISLLGLLTFPLAYKLLPALADRGYALARSLGLLIWGYLFWMLGSLGVLQNDVGGQIFALVVLAALGFWAWRSLDKTEIRQWLRRQRRMILIVDVLFLLAFAAWAIVRAANPEITGTEKPMELAFINAILRSPSLPPNDPWLSGYSISYYYFGYVLVAMLARLTATSGGVAFNLGLALIFGLGAIGSYSLLYNLLAAWKSRPQAEGRKRSAVDGQPSAFPALLAPFYVLIVSNLSGLLHILRVKAVFWQQNAAGEWVSPFWKWLDIGSYSTPPPGENFPFWWWWQGSRIVQDYDYLWHNKGDVIDEFPFFSFLLGDLHPHVLALPFAFLAMSLALNLILGGGRGALRWLGLRLRLNWPAFGLAAFALGAMGFLNTWDFPFYVALFAGAYVVTGWKTAPADVDPAELPADQPSLLQALKDFLSMGLALGLTGGLLYLPFYLGFSSQAGGLLPNLIYITKGVYEWIMFAPLLIPLFGFLFYLAKRHADRPQLLNGLKATLVVVGLLLAGTALFTALIAVVHIFQGVNDQAGIAASAFLGSLQAPGFREAILEGFRRRLTTPGTLLTLVALLTLVFAVLWPSSGQRSAVGGQQQATNSKLQVSPSTIFALLLTLLGALLVLVPEFLYLRDFFGYRINTIFKFYYLAWLLWAIAAAYATNVLWDALHGVAGLVFKTTTFLVLALALLYPVMGLWSKTNGFKPAQWELDGAAYLMRYNPDEAAAIVWLRAAPLGVLAEAAYVYSPYTNYARMSTHSGQVAVLGWVGHEHQWRGGYAEMGTREADLQRLYCAPDWPQTQAILAQYGIRYIVIGNLERSTYAAGTPNCPSGLSEGKFVRYLEPVFQLGSVTIYQVP